MEKKREFDKKTWFWQKKRDFDNKKTRFSKCLDGSILFNVDVEPERSEVYSETLAC